MRLARAIAATTGYAKGETAFAKADGRVPRVQRKQARPVLAIATDTAFAITANAIANGAIRGPGVKTSRTATVQTTATAMEFATWEVVFVNLAGLERRVKPQPRDAPTTVVGTATVSRESVFALRAGVGQAARFKFRAVPTIAGATAPAWAIGANVRRGGPGIPVKPLRHRAALTIAAITGYAI